MYIYIYSLYTSQEYLMSMPARSLLFHFNHLLFSEKSNHLSAMTDRDRLPAVVRKTVALPAPLLAKESEHRAMTRA